MGDCEPYGAGRPTAELLGTMRLGTTDCGPFHGMRALVEPRELRAGASTVTSRHYGQQTRMNCGPHGPEEQRDFGGGLGHRDW